MGLRSWFSGSSGSSGSSSSSDSPPSYSSLFGSGDSKSSSDKPPSYDSLFGSGSSSRSNSNSGSSSSSNRYSGSSSSSSRDRNSDSYSSSSSDSDIMSGLGFLFAGSALTGTDSNRYGNRSYTSAAIRSAAPPTREEVIRGVKYGICLTVVILVFLMVFFGLVAIVIHFVSARRIKNGRKTKHKTNGDTKIAITDISFPEDVHLRNNSNDNTTEKPQSNEPQIISKNVSSTYR